MDDTLFVSDVLNSYNLVILSTVENIFILYVIQGVYCYFETLRYFLAMQLVFMIIFRFQLHSQQILRVGRMKTCMRHPV